jgi:prepilin-type N-terminal cleavage/methylation domain-containing protein
VRRPPGFTIFEIIIVLLLMSIVAATVVGHSVTTANMDLNSAADQLRNHLRLAQADAMKRSDAVWGISYANGEYWLFRSTPNDKIRLPGVDSDNVKLPNGITIGNLTDVYFDRIGKPYTAYTSASTNTALTIQMTITVSAGGDNRTITIIPETGLIQ